MNDLNHKLIWSMYEEMGRAERHFNGLQAGYRKLVAGWILALFGALGFLLYPSNISVTANESMSMTFIFALGLVAFAGITALWILDLLVYHRLLLAYFFAGEDLETANHWLPPVRTNMLKLNEKWPVMHKVIVFYVVSLAICAGISIGAVMQLLQPDWRFDLLAFGSSIVSAAVLYGILQRQTKTDLQISQDTNLEHRSIRPTTGSQ